MSDLMEYIKECPWCGGAGKYEQMYNAGCGNGYYRMMGPCSCCGKDEPYEGVGYVYRATGEPVPASVLAQIKNSLG